MKRLAIALVLAGAMVAAMVAVAPGEQSGHIMLQSADLKWGEGPASLPPGAKLVVIEGVLANPGPFTARLKFPAGFTVKPHWHPAIEHVTVLSGTLHFGTGEKFDPKKMKAMRAGSFIVMPPQSPHFASAKGETILQIHGVGPWGVTYVNPEDDPRKK